MSEDIYIEGIIENVVYRNEENGYTVFTVIRTDSNAGRGKATDIEEEVTCTASMPQINTGEHIRLSGSFVVHSSYGRQFTVSNYERMMPTTLLGMEKYLGSGVIKGIGERMAKRIVDTFGIETFNVIADTPEKLATIKGITVDKALSIGAVFSEHTALRNIMIFLQEFGITPVYAQKIYTKYKDKTIDVIKHNPYTLADDVSGIGFKIADGIAYRLGVESESPFRIQAGIKYSLNLATTSGHVYLPKDVLISHASELLGVSETAIENNLMQLQFERIIWQEMYKNELIIYLNMYYYAESYVAKKLLELSLNATDKSKSFDKEIAEIEKQENIQLADNQKTAVYEALSQGVLVITGGPGTGKTTTINTIIQLLEQESYEIALAAPTGRAAKRMAAATGREAKTIHRLLGMSYGSSVEEEGLRPQKFEHDDENLLESDVFIIDESSMVDIMLMYHLLKAIPYGSRLILVGDVDQLPSVGPGNVLHDIIDSAKIPVVTLNEIFRQAQESAIIMNAHRINAGEYPKINEKEKDFFFVKRGGIDETVKTIIDLITKRLPDYMDCDSMKDIQVLTPMRKSPVGVNSLNTVLQEALNPSSPQKKEKNLKFVTFREGDKVMQIKNNYNIPWRVFGRGGNVIEEGIGVFNGDEGIIEKIDEFQETLRVLFDDGRTVDYDFSQLIELELSYAVTIHKSQGSEYNVVIIPIHSGPPTLMNRNLLYTAVTRAKQLVVIVGIPETLYKMVDNLRETSRYSTLSYRINKMNKFMTGEIEGE